MRAIAVEGYGAPPLAVTLPRPEPGPGEILVKLVAAGVNPVDWKIADGAFKDAMPASFPLVLGTDGAGVVAGIGPGVTRFAVGEQIFGRFGDAERGVGSYAEYAVVREDAPLAAMPAGMIYTQAAAVPTATGTAFALVDTARVDAGQVVLVVGATGGVGQAAVQYAADMGAHVIATARDDMIDEMKRLGAAETIDHTAGDLSARLLADHPDGIDAILDVVGSRDEVTELAGLLKTGGVYLSTIGSVPDDLTAERELRGENVHAEITSELLERIAEMIDAARIRVAVHREVALGEAPVAIAAARLGGSRGKTVIRI
ncbi:NADP-dependent oxidoreductase [Actinomadura flavalba]|uniref:NADP-dependent oxidoreductase n=1 Tax=Actinomadura flavalba TaxID=1120938 RepID=UPI000366B5A2|nr:NADP-dependent oxidoreductase [Actinomadura flavalba]